MMNRRAFWLGLAAVVACCGASPAVSTEVWTESSARDFQKGRLEQLSVDDRGRVYLAPSLVRPAGIRSQYVWCVTQDAKGVVYAGGGSPGVIYRLAGGEAEEFYRSSEMHVHSIAVDKNGVVYAGTSPRGIIYRITPEKVVTIFHDAPDSYIWALAFDPAGNLVVATGNSARILRISPDGKATEVYASPETHILCVAVGPKGDIYAGTAPGGLVYHAAPTGAVRVLCDMDESELRAMALDGNRLYVGTAISREARSEPPPETGPGGAPPAREPGKPLAAPPRKPPSNGVYEIDLSTGRVFRCFECGSFLVMALAVAPDGALYVGTGEEGKLFRLYLKEQREELVLDLPEKEVLSILPRPGKGLWLACGNSGGVVMAEERLAAEGTYTSPVKDAEILARWGRISWWADTPADTQVVLETRSGNGKRPDDTWSAWSPECTVAAGTPIASPAARFFQFRARLRSKSPKATPLLREVKAAFLRTNLAPVVSEIGRDGPPVPKTTSAEGPREMLRLGRPSLELTPPEPHSVRSPQAKVYWKASDPNGDKLVYRLYFRGAEEREWKPLAEELTATSYSWDTSSVPDGRYQVRVAASDAPDNPPGTDLEGERTSDEILVDNTRPVLKRIAAAPGPGGRTAISGAASDELSYIEKLEISLDGGRWVALSAADGVFDSREEEFRFTTGALKPGEHCAVVRITDAADNVGAGKIVFTVAEGAEGAK